jgi:predicted signal transduction protein with EAL and GGDEF domain
MSTKLLPGLRHRGPPGGDYFVARVPHLSDTAGALRVAKKIRQALIGPFEVAERRLNISTSVGAALCLEHGTNEQQLTQQAD